MTQDISFKKILLLNTDAMHSDSSNGSQGPHSHHYSTSLRSTTREPSVSSLSSNVGHAPRLKRSPYRVYKKAASCSFEKSVDSTTSVDGNFSRCDVACFSCNC